MGERGEGRAMKHSERFYYADRWRPSAVPAFRRRLVAKRFESQWRGAARPMVRPIDLFVSDDITVREVGIAGTAEHIRLVMYGETR